MKHNKVRIAILGSTGSIGTQALEIIKEHHELFEIVLLSAHQNLELLNEQAKTFRARYAVLSGLGHTQTNLQLGDPAITKTYVDPLALNELVCLPEIDIVLNSLVGFAGFAPTFYALKAHKKVALANKESLVVGGAIITELLKECKGSLIPIDSEHSAMLQSLIGEEKEAIEEIIITASGGPFRTLSLEQMKDVTVKQALQHPNWSMGSKITIDSATMMNKGLEIIEAHWLFDLPIEKITPVVHPESIIHSMVTYIDGSTKAQLGPPDMKVPILYALSYPRRLPLESSRMDWSKMHKLHFEPVDYSRFPCIELAMESVKLHNGVLFRG
jgi:1-deoxy-D-xylulose-5-phosphate reductoisomerase